MSGSELTLPMPPRPMGTWREQAACRGLDPALFFPEKGDDGHAAKAVCAVCPVRAECLRWALTVPEKDGIWGGVAPHARRGRTIPHCIDCDRVYVRTDVRMRLCDDCRAARRRETQRLSRAGVRQRQRESA